MFRYDVLMCQSKSEGGKRCVYADQLSNVRRKVRNSKSYQRADRYTQEKMLNKKVEAWKKQNPDIVTNHLPAHMNMNTRAAAWSEEKAQSYLPQFPRRTTVWTEEENVRRTQELAAEHDRLNNDDVPLSERNALHFYTISGYSDVNHFLRFGKAKYPERDSEEDRANIERHIRSLEKLTQHKSETPHTLYRHMIVPTGVKEDDYIEKYFKVGERVRDEGFLSTSEDPGYIAGHIHSRKPSRYVVFEIVTPQGISLQMESQERRGSVQSFEKERLLPAGTNFRVVNVKQQRLKVPEDREELKKQFGKYSANIPPKTVSIVQLIDEQYAKTL